MMNTRTVEVKGYFIRLVTEGKVIKMMIKYGNKFLEEEL